MSDALMNVSALRVSAVTYEAPPVLIDPLEIRVSTATASAVSYIDPPRDAESISLTVSTMLTSAVSYIRPPFNAKAEVMSARLVLLVTPPKPSVNALRFVSLINQIDHGPPIHSPQQRQEVLSFSPVPHPSSIISDEDASTIYSSAIQQAEPFTFPWSNTGVKGVQHSYLLNAPIKTMSYNSSMGVVFSAIRRVYMPEAISDTEVLFSGHSYLISLDTVYEPISMNYNYGVSSQSLIRDEALSSLPISDVGSVMATGTALIGSNLYSIFPFASTTIPSAAKLVLHSNVTPLEFGDESYAFAGYSAIIDSRYTFPYSDTDSSKVVMSALSQSIEGLPLSYSSAALIYKDVLVNVHTPMPMGHVITSMFYAKGLISSAYPSPREMSGVMAGGALVSAAVSVAFPEPAGVWSSVGVAHSSLNWLVGATYIPAGDLLAPPRSAMLPTITHITLKENPQLWVRSQEKVPHLSTMAIQSESYDPPEVVFNAGVFIDAVQQQVVYADYFPPATEPVSILSVSSAIQVGVVSDGSLPDKSYSTSDLRVGLMQGQIISGDSSYPDKNIPQSNLELCSISKTPVFSSDYPDKSITQSELRLGLVLSLGVFDDGSYPCKGGTYSKLEVGQAAAQPVATEIYPDKNKTHSFLRPTSVLGVSVQPSTYPDKDKAQSSLLSDFISAFDVRRDSSLVGIPITGPRRNIRVSVTVVY